MVYTPNPTHPQPDPEEMALLISTEANYRDVLSAVPHLTLNQTSICSATLTGNLWVFSSYHTITCISFSAATQKTCGKKTLSIYCVKIKLISSIIRSYQSSHNFSQELQGHCDSDVSILRIDEAPVYFIRSIGFI